MKILLMAAGGALIGAAFSKVGFTKDVVSKLSAKEKVYWAVVFIVGQILMSVGLFSP